MQIAGSLCHVCMKTSITVRHTRPVFRVDTPGATLLRPSQVGYGRKTYNFTRDLLLSWGQFQLPWAQVDPATSTKPGTAVCVTANVFGLWTAVPLEVV